MIRVTENKYLDGTGEIWTVVEYPKFDGYNVIVGGNLSIWRSNLDPEQEPLEYVTYKEGSWVKVHKS